MLRARGTRRTVCDRQRAGLRASELLRAGGGQAAAVAGGVGAGGGVGWREQAAAWAGGGVGRRVWTDQVGPWVAALAPSPLAHLPPSRREAAGGVEAGGGVGRWAEGGGSRRQRG